MNLFKGILEIFLDAIYPNRCVGCGEIIPKDDGFCDYCFEMLSKTAGDKRCKVCGSRKKDCLCHYRVFHFTSATAPYYNEGVAKKAMWDFKFRRKIQFGRIFARQMALAVKTDFYGVDFDTVVYVPMPLKKRLKRGYNQSRELAVKVAEILNITLVENALGCNNKRYIQHKTHFKERFQNVKGVYYPNVSLKGRTVLLVDDIKTTGATLDECARALLKAGAIEVYCITGLISKKKDPKKKGKKLKNG